jgi:adenylate cyclase
LPEAFSALATANYLDAFRKLQTGDRLAMPAFAALVGTGSDDQLAGFHLRRLLNGATGATIVLD